MVVEAVAVAVVVSLAAEVRTKELVLYGTHWSDRIAQVVAVSAVVDTLLKVPRTRSSVRQPIQVFGTIC